MGLGGHVATTAASDATPRGEARKAAFLSRRANDSAAIAGRHWPRCQDDGTKPKCADWRLGTPGQRKRAVGGCSTRYTERSQFRIVLKADSPLSTVYYAVAESNT
jgi:hypothetical protein